MTLFFTKFLDPFGGITFGVVTNEHVAADFFMRNSKDIIYRRVLNETLVNVCK